VLHCYNSHEEHAIYPTLSPDSPSTPISCEVMDELADRTVSVFIV
jgi:hypothetical protein